MAKPRILTGMRPTGRLHLGHYVGALRTWVELEQTGDYDCYFLVADVQALTDHAQEPKLIHESVYQVTLDWLSVGLDPQRPSFTLQSWLPETDTLWTLLSMFTPESWLERNPTLAAEIAELKARKKKRGELGISAGFMDYPGHQAADIFLVAGSDRASILVPVGEDQVPHIELSREIARLFKRLYNSAALPEPLAKVGHVGRLVGTDGRAKMSKSLGNVIELSASSSEVEQRVRGMFTDPRRTRPDIPVDSVVNNPVFIYLRAFHPDQARVNELEALYKAGRIGDVAVKKELSIALNMFLGPIRERRAQFEAQGRKYIFDLLRKGTERERRLAQETLSAVKKAMGLVYV